MPMAIHDAGSIWSVPSLEDAPVVILSGPFAAARGVPEYLVAPIYSDQEPGFAWTDEDVLLHPDETGLDGEQYAAVWNTRPMLEADLGLQLGTLPREVIELLKDFYWASVNERNVGKHERTGRAIRSAKDPAASFQARELERWEPLSGRLFADAVADKGVGFVQLGHDWIIHLDEFDLLWDQIEASEKLLGDSVSLTVTPGKVEFTTPMAVTPFPPDDTWMLFQHMEIQPVGADPSLQISWSGNAEPPMVEAEAGDLLAEAA